MDEVERLRQELRTAQEREEAARERAEIAQKRAETAQKRAEVAQERAETAEERSEHTTLPVFLELCHKLLSEPLQVQMNRSLTTKGRSLAHVERSILHTCARGTTFRNYNSSISIALIRCCVPMSPALASSFPHVSPSKTSDIPFVADLLPARKIWNHTNASQWRRRSRM